MKPSSDIFRGRQEIQNNKTQFPIPPNLKGLDFPCQLVTDEKKGRLPWPFVENTGTNCQKNRTEIKNGEYIQEFTTTSPRKKPKKYMFKWVFLKYANFMPFCKFFGTNALWKTALFWSPEWLSWKHKIESPINNKRSRRLGL